MLNWFKGKPKPQPVIDTKLASKVGLIIDDLVKQNVDMSIDDIVCSVSGKLGIRDIIKSKMLLVIQNGLYKEDKDQNDTEVYYRALDKPGPLSLQSIKETMDKITKNLAQRLKLPKLTEADQTILNSVTLQPDKKQRVRIPAEIIKQLKAKPGDQVQINATITAKHKKTVDKHPAAAGWEYDTVDEVYITQQVKTYTVDKYHNIRVALKPLNLGHLKSVYCVVNKNTIQLS